MLNALITRAEKEKHAFLDGTLLRELTARSRNLLRDKVGEYAPRKPPSWQCCHLG
jgi:hypothetical protein